MGLGGRLAGIETCQHSEPAPGEIDLSWAWRGGRGLDLAHGQLNPYAATFWSR